MLFIWVPLSLPGRSYNGETESRGFIHDLSFNPQPRSTRTLSTEINRLSPRHQLWRNNNIILVMNNTWWRNLWSFIQKLVDILFKLWAKHLQAIVYCFLSFREMGIIFLQGEENITTLLEPLDTSKVFSFPLHFWIVFFSSGEHGQVKWLPLRQHHLHGDHHRDQLLGGQDHPREGENANPRSDRLRLLRQHLVQPAHSLLSVPLVCSPVMLSTLF